jgi:hypothetical protein
MSLICRSCGHRNPDRAQFCANQQCGAYLGWEGQFTMSAPDPAGPTGPSGPAQRQRRGLHAQLSDSTLTVTPGDACSATVTLRNTGTLVEGVRVSIGGPAAAWATAEPAELSVYPEQTATCTVTFSPARGPQCPAGIAGFVVRCASTVHQGLVATASGTVAVAAFHELSIHLDPAIARGRRTTRHQVHLENRGNVVEHVQLTASDAEGALRFDPAATTLDVAPGRRTVPLAVKSRWRWFGTPRIVPIQATARPLTPHTGQPPVRTDGTRHIVSLLPTWALAGAVVLGLLGGGSAAALQLTSNPVAVAPLPTTSAVTETPPPTEPPTPTTPTPTTTTAPPSTTTTAPPSSTTTTTKAPPKEPGPLATESCTSYDPARLDIQDLGAEWKLFAGSAQILLLANGSDAEAALAEAKRYTKICFLDRDNPDGHTVTLWRGRLNDKSTIADDACESYNPASLRVRKIDYGFQLLDESGTLTLLTLDNANSANDALKWAKAFSKLCFIGRDNTSPDPEKYTLEYWKP